jgi:hypothetical protein
MSDVERNGGGMISGPVVSLGDSERTFVGEAHELLKEVDLLASSRGLSSEAEDDIRRMVDAALGVGFDYGAQFGRNGGT